MSGCKFCDDMTTFDYVGHSEEDGDWRMLLLVDCVETDGEIGWTKELQLWHWVDAGDGSYKSEDGPTFSVAYCPLCGRKL